MNSAVADQSEMSNGFHPSMHPYPIDKNILDAIYRFSCFLNHICERYDQSHYHDRLFSTLRAAQKVVYILMERDSHLCPDEIALYAESLKEYIRQYHEGDQPMFEEVELLLLGCNQLFASYTTADHAAKS